MAFGVADGGSPLPLETGAVTGGGVVGTTMYEGESKPLDTELFLPDLADLAVEIPFPFPWQQRLFLFLSLKPWKSTNIKRMRIIHVQVYH